MRRDSPEVFEPRDDSSLTLAAARGWTAEGLITAFEPMVTDARRERLLAVLSDRVDSVTLLMDAPHDPHNGAAIIRSCDAFGVQHVHVIPREEEFLASSVVTKGSDQWVDVIRHPTPSDAVIALRKGGYTLIGSHPKGEFVPSDLARLERVAIVLGNEHDGICAELGRAIDHTVRIPMRGFVESLNVSVSAAILVAHAVASRPGDLKPRARNELYARWLLRTVPRSQEILEGLQPR